MWKEQALARREGEVQTSPTTNDLLLAHDRKDRTHSAARDWQRAQEEGGLPESRAPQVPISQVFTVSKDCLEFKPSTYLHWEPTNSSDRVGQGVVIKARNQTQTRPDQSMGAASGPGLTSLGCTFLGLLPPMIFLPGQFFTKFDTSGLPRPNFKSRVP